MKALSFAFEEAADHAVRRQWFKKFDGAYEGCAYSLRLDCLDGGAGMARESFEVTGAILD
jgi:hypothetical protein